ncbi:putative rRNA maturation factor [Mycobacterium kansasii 732]|uniref:Putative rRNA maturation factor n=1 Tax=Mycobacterium kansasii TaxID=1768 RepID=A0A1V3XJI7_MYCKA|nr:putative rRNA maturation factor [Mycobacterium kansasii 732]OOK79373.1 putative rRNA maturation factor [Mycobacterium kansasii]
MSIEVSNESGVDVSEAELVSVARFVIEKMDVNPGAELSMVLLDTAAMADLHMRWMDLPGPTDVMSFPMDELEPGGVPTRPSPARRCSAISCCARNSRRSRRPRRDTASDMSWRC